MGGGTWKSSLITFCNVLPWGQKCPQVTQLSGLCPPTPHTRPSASSRVCESKWSCTHPHPCLERGPPPGCSTGSPPRGPAVGLGSPLSRQLPCSRNASQSPLPDLGWLCKSRCREVCAEVHPTQRRSTNNPILRTGKLRHGLANTKMRHPPADFSHP